MVEIVEQGIIQQRQIKELDRLRDRIYNDPEFFLYHVLGCTYWRKQVEIIKSIRDNRRTTVSGCTGSSKTMGEAMALLWWMNVWKDAKAFSLAPSMRQVELNLWGYAKNLWQKSKMKLGGEFLTNIWKLDTERYAIGFTSDDPEKVKGFHAPHALVLLDDAQGIQQPIFDALRNVMSSENTHMAMFFNKNIVSGECYESYHEKRHLYNSISIPASITPNVKSGKELIPGMISKSFVDESIETYGEDSDYVRSMILDEFPKAEPDSLVPIDWLTKAQFRVIEPEDIKDKNIIGGLDVAEEGNDESILTMIRDRVLLLQNSYRIGDLWDLCEAVGKDFKDVNGQIIGVDDIGVGHGAPSNLKRLGIRAISVDYREVSSEPNKYYRLRDEVLWGIRESLNPKNPNAISVPRDSTDLGKPYKKLYAELTSIKYKIIMGVIRIETKDLIKKKIKRSPDRTDSFGIALHTQKKKYKIIDEHYLTIGSSDDD